MQAASSPPLSPADVSKPWTRLYVPEADGTERVIATPQGYFALTRQTIGEPRAPSGWSSYLYRWNHGVRWQQILRHQREVLFGFRGIAHGNGRFVMAGSSGAGSEIWSSSDAASWDVTKVATAPGQLHGVVFENERFFVLSTDRGAVHVHGWGKLDQCRAPDCAPERRRIRRGTLRSRGKWADLCTPRMEFAGMRRR